MIRQSVPMPIGGSSYSPEPGIDVANESSHLRLLKSGGRPDLNALLGAVAVGDEDAFAKLYDAIGPAVYGLARRVVRDPARAEEIAQEVFLSVWQQATRFDPEKGSARTWILTLTHRRAVDVVRQSEASSRRDHAAAPNEREFDDVAETVMLRDEQMQMHRCLETLTSLQHEAVRLAYFNGYTYQEVATLLGTPLPTMKTRMRDGLIRLRDCMEGAR
jgi:RNA polymerase sigma-70 factor, ECF subfamily